jgi:hypothetical protein
MTTLQTPWPLERLSLHATARLAHHFADTVMSGDGTVDQPYQRGAVWSQGQQIALIWSYLSGVPIPAILTNDRSTPEWAQANPGYDQVTDPYYAVIDGKQRILATIAWFDGTLAVPASWFAPKYVMATENTEDGPYVRFTGLTVVGQRICKRDFLLPCAEAHFPTIEREAEIYLLVNGGGTPQTGADMANAARVAAGKGPQ